MQDKLFSKSVLGGYPCPPMAGSVTGHGIGSWAMPAPRLCLSLPQPVTMTQAVQGLCISPRDRPGGQTEVESPGKVA